MAVFSKVLRSLPIVGRHKSLFLFAGLYRLDAVPASSTMAPSLPHLSRFSTTKEAAKAALNNNPSE
jgi:hypothetical protein